ncbi:Rieske (2Fe-2S) protein [Flavobacterium crassostreae]|uniref:Rieske domain-containing protein n=1 Tax=Flavobacterium crassostreae TaxID=1763534 RepID=A0A1B9E4K2_9FLAO|nr:hypothetical protein [Flavobacterium crassostreae]OCB76884.1 hypothetical protein LPBF_05580 [Flavobacterium crassostreae]
MKNYILLLFAVATILGCSNNENRNKNPNIPNYSFTFDLNLNLPAYSNLKFASNAIYYPTAGAKGVFVFCTAPGSYTAFDAACPNQEISSCTQMTLKGINLVCSCDKSQYSLFTGQGSLPNPLKPYRVEVNGMLLRVYN